MEKISADTIIACCAVFIALCALGVSIWQGMETRKHNKLSVKPYLSILVIVSKHEPYIGIRIYNNGLGPAIIKKYIVFVNKTPFLIDSYESLVKASTVAGIFDKKVSFLALREGAIIKEGQEIPLISYLKDNQTEEGIKKFEEALAYRLRVKIIYESIYKEEFEVTNLEK